LNPAPAPPIALASRWQGVISLLLQLIGLAG
jgi:hypothetical protein